MRTKAFTLAMGLLLILGLSACGSKPKKISIAECDSAVLMTDGNYSADFTALGEDRPVFVELGKIYDSLELLPCSAEPSDNCLKLRFLKKGALTASLDLDENGVCRLNSGIYQVKDGADIYNRLLRIFNTDKSGNINY